MIVFQIDFPSKDVASKFKNDTRLKGVEMLGTWCEVRIYEMIEYLTLKQILKSEYGIENANVIFN